MTLREAMRRFESAYFTELLAKYKWRMGDAAREAGIVRSALARNLQKLGIERRYEGPTVTLSEARRRFEFEYFKELLQAHRWKIADVARTAGYKQPVTCYKKLESLGLIHRKKGRKMRKWLQHLILVGAFTPAFGAPFLVTDPVPNTVPGSTCTMFMDAVPGVTLPVALASAPAVGNICQFDLALLAVGVHSVTVTATNPPDPFWGGGGSSSKSLPLAFQRPASSAPPSVPTGLRLTP